MQATRDEQLRRVAHRAGSGKTVRERRCDRHARRRVVIGRWDNARGEQDRCVPSDRIEDASTLDVRAAERGLVGPALEPLVEGLRHSVAQPARVKKLLRIASRFELGGAGEAVELAIGHGVTLEKLQQRHRGDYASRGDVRASALVARDLVERDVGQGGVHRIAERLRRSRKRDGDGAAHVPTRRDGEVLAEERVDRGERGCERVWYGRGAVGTSEKGENDLVIERGPEGERNCDVLAGLVVADEGRELELRADRNGGAPVARVEVAEARAESAHLNRALVVFDGEDA